MICSRSVHCICRRGLVGQNPVCCFARSDKIKRTARSSQKLSRREGLQFWPSVPKFARRPSQTGRRNLETELATQPINDLANHAQSLDRKRKPLHPQRGR